MFEEFWRSGAPLVGTPGATAGWGAWLAGEPAAAAAAQAAGAGARRRREERDAEAQAQQAQQQTQQQEQSGWEELAPAIRARFGHGLRFDGEGNEAAAAEGPAEPSEEEEEAEAGASVGCDGWDEEAFGTLPTCMQQHPSVLAGGAARGAPCCAPHASLLCSPPLKPALLAPGPCLQRRSNKRRRTSSCWPGAHQLGLVLSNRIVACAARQHCLPAFPPARQQAQGACLHASRPPGGSSLLRNYTRRPSSASGRP